MGWPKLDMSDLHVIHSNIDLLMYLNENLNIWTGPKIKTTRKVLKIVAKSILFTETRLSDEESSS